MVYYDFEKTVQEGRFTGLTSLNRPPDVLLNAVNILQANHLMEEPQLIKHLSEMVSRYPKMKKASTYPGEQHDQLFQADYNHQAGCDTCANCEPSHMVSRSARGDIVPGIHYGLIASGNQVMKNGLIRETLRRELNVLCFEMEAAGLTTIFHV